MSSRSDAIEHAHHLHVRKPGETMVLRLLGYENM
jgi:hypothetical protein